ncbi:MAG: hypothetical protein H6738_16485 [Alphaproteobacteria bacterium]|nr:hypothetical protein [Alphaproteobacteria bacterium]MCB9698379.1 hypothetical protein [Alphaproteobacteria bacterium]
MNQTASATQERGWSNVQLTIVPTEHDEPVRLPPRERRRRVVAHSPAAEMVTERPAPDLRIAPAPARRATPRVVPPTRGTRSRWLVAGAMWAGMLLGGGLVGVCSLIAAGCVAGVAGMAWILV